MSAADITDVLTEPIALPPGPLITVAGPQAEPPQVRIEIESNGEVALTVQDCGVGLTLSELQNLFRPSYRSERVVEVAGTGLGLYASRVIVEAHGGRIWAESRGAGQGSAFHIVLPR